MKHDPYKQPLRLSSPPQGRWQYKERGMKKALMGGNFWEVAKRLASYREANKLPRRTFEEAQLDLLCEARKRLGRSCAEDQKQNAPVTQMTPEAVRSLKIKEFKQRYEGGGCRSCGQRRAAAKLKALQSIARI